MTLEQAREYVLARLGISSGESDALETQVNRQLDLEYQRLVLVHLLNVDAANLIETANDPVVELPDDLTAILKITRGSTVMRPVGFDEFASLVAAGPGTSGPYAYAVSGSQRIRLHPTPTADSSELMCWFAAAASPWDQDGEVPRELPAAFHDIPCERVVAWLALLDEAIDLAAAATARADELESMLRRHMGRRGGMDGSVIQIAGLR